MSEFGNVGTWERAKSRNRMFARACLRFCLLFVVACGAVEEEVPIEPPQVLSDSAPFEYPLELWDQKISAQTVLLLKVSELGTVDSVMVGTSSGYDQFDSAAVHGARVMKFTPGRQGERRVAMWTKLPVRFARDTAPPMGIGGE